MSISGRSPAFTIVLPTHGRADVLPFAIRSALWQTEGDFELLIAGDGCTDRTAEVVRSFDDPRIAWFDLPKAPGVGYANRNAVLRRARGDLIAYLGHDDIWLPDHLEALGARLRAADAELVHSRLLTVDGDGRLRPHTYNLEVPGHRATLWRAHMAITMAVVVHTRACLTRYGYWSEDLSRMADVEMWHRILAGGGFARAAFVSAPTVLHFASSPRRTTGGLTRAARLITGGALRSAESLMPSLTPMAGETLQAAAWRLLDEDRARRVQDIRDGVVRYQDSLLWSGRSSLGLAGLRLGLALAAGVDRVVQAVVRIASPRYRADSAAVRERTRRVKAAEDAK